MSAAKKAFIFSRKFWSIGVAFVFGLIYSFAFSAPRCGGPVALVKSSTTACGDLTSGCVTTVAATGFGLPYLFTCLESCSDLGDVEGRSDRGVPFEDSFVAPAALGFFFFFLPLCEPVDLRIWDAPLADYLSWLVLLFRVCSSLSVLFTILIFYHSDSVKLARGGGPTARPMVLFEVTSCRDALSGYCVLG